jgi:hypothetical protein
MLKTPLHHAGVQTSSDYWCICSLIIIFFLQVCSLEIIIIIGIFQLVSSLELIYV